MKHLFLLDPEIIFLNHGSFGACPREVLAVQQDWQLQQERQPVEFLARRSGALLEQARGELASFLGTSADRLVFVTNATTAVNSVARSPDLRPGDEVLATDQEYGACDLVWEQVCRQQGARYVKVPVLAPGQEPWSAGDFLERFWQQVRPATRAIFFSHITSATALILPAEQLCARARESGILTVVDGAHVPGQLPLDLERLGADVYTGNCHKWLCAPRGSAFLYVRPEHQLRFDAAVISWGYAEDGIADHEAYTGRTPFVRRHQWQGTRDLSAFLSVPAALRFWRDHGWEQVRDRCHRLALEARERLAALGGLPALGSADSFAQMVAVPLPPCDPHLLKARLHEEFRIEVPLTSAGERLFVRISVQGYNEAAELEALVEALASLLGWSRA